MTAVSPRVYNLGDLTITAPDTQEEDWVDNLDGMIAVTIQARFAYGSGGTNVILYVQTSLDDGVTPIDVVALEFDTSSAVYVVNLSGTIDDESIKIPTDGLLDPGYVVNGVLGDRLRIKIVSTGTYAGSTLLSVRASVR